MSATSTRPGCSTDRLHRAATLKGYAGAYLLQAEGIEMWRFQRYVFVKAMQLARAKEGDLRHAYEQAQAKGLADAEFENSWSPTC